MQCAPPSLAVAVEFRNPLGRAVAAVHHINVHNGTAAVTMMFSNVQVHPTALVRRTQRRARVAEPPFVFSQTERFIECNGCPPVKVRLRSHIVKSGHEWVLRRRQPFVDVHGVATLEQDSNVMARTRVSG